jgi:hypothetical protein
MPNLYIGQETFNRYLAEHGNVEDAKEEMQRAVKEAAPTDGDG